MSVSDSESMVLDFDGWLGGQDQETRSGIDQHLQAVPESNRGAEKQKLASMFAVAESTGLDLPIVGEKWDTIRGGFAEKQGGAWLAVKDNEPGFFGELQKQKQQARDERWLLQGLDDPKAPNAEQSWEDSLVNRAREAAYAGKSYGDALGDWQDMARGKPGYSADDERSTAYADIAKSEFEGMAAVVAKARPVAEQAFKSIEAAREGQLGNGGDAAPFALFRGLSKEEKQIAFRMMADSAGDGPDKSDWMGLGQATGEALGRGFENLALGGGAAAWRSRLLQSDFTEGMEVRSADPIEEVRGAYFAEQVARSGASSARPVFYSQPTRKLSAVEAEQWNERIAQTREDLDTAEELRKFGQETIDPANKSGSWVRRKLWLPAADSAAIMATMAVPGGWAPALELGARSYQNDEYQRLRSEGMDAQQADRLALVTGAAQAVLDKAELGVLTKGIPGTKRVLEQFALRSSTAVRFGANIAATTGAETLIELTQDQVVPALVQDNLTSDPAFDVKWGDVWRDVAKTAPETALGMVLLSGLGGIHQTREQSAFVRDFSSSGAAMRARGYSLDQIAEIQAAPVEVRGELLAQYLPAKAPTGAERAALAKESAELANGEREAFAEKQRAETTNNAEAGDYAIRVTRSGEGWKLTTGDKTIFVNSAEAAVRIRDDLKQAATAKEAEGLVALIDQWHDAAPEGVTRETALTADKVTTDGETIERQRHDEAEARSEKMSPEVMASLHEQARMDAQMGGGEAIHAIINGSNVVEFREKIADRAEQLVQRLEINRSDVGPALTFLHESVEADFRAGVASGAISQGETQQAIAGLAGQFDPFQARDAEERAFRERVQRVASGKASDVELRETLSELAVANAMGRRKDGGAFPAGSVTAGIDSAIRDQVKPEAVRAFGTVRAFLAGVKTHFRALFGTAAALKKARREGKAAAFDALIAKITGVDQQQKFDRERIAEAEAIAAESEIDYTPPSEEEQAAGVAFSLKPVLAAAREKPRGVKPESVVIGKLKGGMAAKLPEHLRYAEGMSIRVDEDLVRKNDKLASNPKAQRDLDIRPPSDRDYAALYEIMESADSITEGPPRKDSTPTLEFRKQQGDNYIAVTAIRKRAGYLSVVRFVKEGALPLTEPNEGRQELTSGNEGRENDGTDQDEGKTFRLSAGSKIEALQNRIDAALSRDPEARRRIGRRAIDKLQTLQFNAETLRTTPQGDAIRPLVERRTVAELDKEQAFRQAARAEELAAEGMAKLAPETLQALDAGAQKLADGPIASALLEQGKLMSKSEAERRGRQSEYDGAPWLPPGWYGGNLMPDEVAQWLHEAGLLRDGYPDTFWKALGTEVSAQRAANEEFKAASRAAAEVERQARNTAREEAADWRAEEDAKQAKDWSPRAALVRDLRALDAILSVLPPELRGKVGGFVKLATLASDQARLQELGRRITKLSSLLEKHLQKESTVALDALLEKAQPNREDGKASRGKIGAEAHRYFDQVAAVRELTAEQVEAQRDALSKAMDAAPDDQLADLFEQAQILDTFGAWSEKNAADMDAAMTAAQSVYDTGRNRWRTIEEARLAEVAGFAAEVVKTLGGPSYAGTQEQEQKAKTLVGKLKGAALDLKSFAEIMDAFLGENHALAKRWTRAARAGYAARNDAHRAFRKRWKSAIESASGEQGVKARRVVWDMAHVQTVALDTAGRGARSGQSVPIAIIDAWKAGTAEPSALGISDSEASRLIADRAAMKADDRRENLPLSRTAREPSEAVKMTEAKGIFLTMLGAQEQYSAALDLAGYDAAALAAAEEQLSDPAKQLRAFMAAEYRDGYAPLAAKFESMFGVALPQIKNYAPAAFYHLGAEREKSPDGTDTAAGGMRAGFLKNRKQHAAAPRLENAFSTFFGHANQTQHWLGLSEVVREFSGVMRRPEVKQAIEAAHGKAMLKTLTDWTRSLEGDGLQKEAGMIDQAVSWITGQQSYIALAWRLGTLAKQSSAALGSAFRIPLGEYARGFGKLVTGQLDARAMFTSPVIQRRLETGFAPEIRAAMEGAWTAKPTRRAAFMEAGMELIGFTDALFTTGSAAIAYDYHLREAKAAGLSNEAAAGAAMQEVEEIVGRTAQPADAVDRSLFEQRQGAFGRLVFLFASEARQKSSLMLTAWGNTLSGKPTAADFRVLALSHLVLGPMMQAISAAWRDLRDDDDSEWFDAEHWSGLDFLKAVTTGPLQGIPLIGSALSGFRDDGILGRYKKALQSAGQLWSGPEEKEAEPVEWYVKRIARVMQGMDAFTGVAGSVVEQGFSIADDLLPDSESEQRRKEKAARSRERKARKSD